MTALAISLGFRGSCSGFAPSADCRRCRFRYSSSGMPGTGRSGTSTLPGATQFTLMLCIAQLIASDLVRLITAALAAA